MAFNTELTRIIRNLTGDLVEPYVYGDERLEELSIVAAQLVQTEVTFEQVYTVDVDNLVLTPDPTTGNRDECFINLVSLKAVCILDQAELRKSAGKSFVIKEYASSVDLKGIFQGRLSTIQEGACKLYQEAKIAYQLGDRNVGEAIVGPFNQWQNSIQYRNGYERR